MRKTIIILSTLFLLFSCDVVKQLGGAYNFMQCNYDYNSIENVEIAGVNLGRAKSVSILQIASLSTILSGGMLERIPFSMTLNLDVENPNEKGTAILNGMEYMIELNDMEFTTGSIDTPVRIEPGQSEVVPLLIKLDLKNLMDSYSKEQVATEMSRFLSISPGQTKVTVKIWPTVLFGKKTIKTPTYIPVTFYVGKKIE